MLLPPSNPVPSTDSVAPQFRMNKQQSFKNFSGIFYPNIDPTVSVGAIGDLQSLLTSIRSVGFNTIDPRILCQVSFQFTLYSKGCGGHATSLTNVLEDCFMKLFDSTTMVHGFNFFS
nr:hypothetical protein CFP56_34263 [Quercus suber]